MTSVSASSSEENCLSKGKTTRVRRGKAEKQSARKVFEEQGEKVVLQ
jgi:hypothetical protein